MTKNSFTSIMMNYFQFRLQQQYSSSARRRRRRESSSNRFVLFTLLCFLFCCCFSIVSSADIGKYFIRNPSSLVAPPGDRVTFECETNIPAEQVRWKLNGRFLYPANESDIRISGNFLIVKVSKHSEKYLQQVGDYQCVAEFGAEALTSIPAQLSIARIDPFLPRQNQTIEVVEGSSIAVVCDTPYSNPLPIIQFYKNEISVETEVGNAVLLDSGILHLHNVSFSDSGNYWCTATNHITTETFIATYATRLIVRPKNTIPRRPPEFIVNPKTPYVAPQDGNITLECASFGNPPPFTTWRKLRGTIGDGQKSVKGNFLNLYNIGIAQEGEYICEAYNGVGDSLTSLTTIILNSLPNITKEPGNLVVEEGGTASLDCVVEGLPKPRVYWVFNGHNIHDDGNIKITENGLKIANVEKKHAGLFQCFANNPMGTVTSPAELKVLPKQITAMANDSTDFDDSISSIIPPITRHHHHQKNNKFHRGKHNKRRKHKGQDMIPPSKPHMNRISDESVMVRWTVPMNSGYPIQFFKIQYKEVSKRNARWMTIDDDIPPHINSYEVRDLRVGQAYKFRIAAVYSNNDNKVGPNSEKFLLQRDTSMKRPIYPPIITTAAPHNTTTIILRWKHMMASVLDGYFIYYREGTSAGDYSKVTVLGSNIEQQYITFLKPATSYDIKVQGFNKAGASNFSAIVSTKTLGQTSTEKPEDNKTGELEKDIIVPNEQPSNLVYILLGSAFVGFWVILCAGCIVCYKCKRKRAEEETKYPCNAQRNLDPKTSNGHCTMNGRSSLNGFIPTIAAHIALDEKETSFVERHNNNRPITPSQLNTSTCDLDSYRLASLDMRSWTEMKPVRTLERTTDYVNSNNSRNSSLQRKKQQQQQHNHLIHNQINQNHHQNNLNLSYTSSNHNINSSSSSNNISNTSNSNVPIGSSNGTCTTNSFRRVPFVSCGNEEFENDLDIENYNINNIKDTKIFPKEHYKSRKHSLNRLKHNSITVE